MLRKTKIQKVIFDNFKLMKEDKKDFKTISEKAIQKGFFFELLLMLKHNKKWWLTPIILILLLFGLLIIIGGSSYAPFIYSLF